MSRRQRSMNLLAGIQPVEKVLEHVCYRRDHRETMTIQHPRELAMAYQDQGPSHSQSGYFAKIGGKELRLSGAALTGLNKLILQPKGMKHWDQYRDQNAMVKAVNNIYDEKADPSMVVRHNGLEVTAILSPNHEIRDAADLLEDFIEPMEERMGDIRGVVAQEEGNGDICSYRFVMGDNFLKGMDDKYGQFMMFLLSCSESGIKPTVTTLGTFRTICTNSAVKIQTIAKWDCKSDFAGFHDKTSETLRMAEHLQKGYAELFGTLANVKLKDEPLDMLHALKNEGLISRGHYDAAKVYAQENTEDGRPVTTQYDLFNALTRAARDLGSIQSQQQAEERALTLFTEPGGVMSRLVEAAAKRRDSEPLVDLA